MATYFDRVAGVWRQIRALTSSAGAGDAGKLVATGVDGRLGHSLTQPEVFIGAPDPLPEYPALVFEAVTIDGQQVYRMKVNQP